MAYRIEFTHLAESDIGRLMDYMTTMAPNRSTSWLRGLMDAINSLQEFPERFGYAAESSEISEDIRQMPYGKDRVSTVFFIV